MKFKIEHESKNRIRIRVDIKRMSIRYADVLLYYLEGNSSILRAKVYERTSGATIYYKDNKRLEVLECLRKFNFEKEEVRLQVPSDTGRSINRMYMEKFVCNFAFNFVKSYFFPSPIKLAHTLFKSGLFVFDGIKSLINKKLNIKVLDAISISLSIYTKDYAGASSIMFLLGMGSMLEEWTHKKSISDLARSMAINVEKVWIRHEDGECLVPISKVSQNDVVVVRAGNIVPFDGKVLDGEAMVNQSSLTGESVPVHKELGGYLYAGSVVEEGEIAFLVDKQNGDTRYEKIIKMIEDSEKLKSSTEKNAINLADKLVPYSLVTSALTYLFTRNITRAISVLMVDYSCGIKLSMPLSVLSAMKEASKYNITVKGGKFLENIAKADIIVFDKTGTLTHATPVVEKLILAHGEDETEILKIAACLEEHFPHSIAKAVVKAADDRALVHDEMHSEIEYVVAHGISSRIDSKKVIIGSSHFVFDDEKVVIDDIDKEKFSNLDPKYTYLYLAIAGKLRAVIGIYDPLRLEAKEVLKSLKELGIKKTIMMTGDNYNTAKAIADEVSVDEYYANVLPEDKASYILKEKEKGNIVVMIGDGINDSPALFASDCGIAINDGAAIAREISDIIIAANDLRELVILKKISNGLTKRVKYNYRFIVGFNSALILGGIVGIIGASKLALYHNLSTMGVALFSTTSILKNDNV